jgi:hypothetical protein
MGGEVGQGDSSSTDDWIWRVWTMDSPQLEHNLYALSDPLRIIDADSAGEVFRRGDANRDGGVNIADAVYTLQNLFAQGPAILCQDAADANDDEAVNIADAVYVLQSLFAQGPAMPPPGSAACGADTTPHPAGGSDLPPCIYCPEACQDPPQACP